MKLTVDKDLCIGCGACIGEYPHIFDFNDDGLAYVIAKEPLDEKEAADAIEICPVSAIKEA